MREANLDAAAAVNTEAGGRTYRRHSLAVRIMHWTNVVAMTTLLMSGLQIFNANPQLHWGKSSYTGRPAVLEIGAVEGTEGSVRGIARVLGITFDTTGFLGVSQTGGEVALQAFPGWLTIPDYYSLAAGRSWHLFFAWVLVINGLAFLAYSIVSRHLGRDLWPSSSDWRRIGAEFVDHLKFRHATGAAATRYNVLQKLAYLGVIFVLVPAIVITGLGMSPWWNGVFAGWVDLVGGRQSARTIHFISASLLVAFVAIHLLQVVVTGLWNNLRSMITGQFRVPEEKGHG